MIDIVCRIVTVIVLCIILLNIADNALKRIRKSKRRKQDKEFVKEFILQFLFSHQEEYGITKHQLQRAAAEVKKDGDVIFGCYLLCTEILRQLAIDEVITVRPISTNEVLQLEKCYEERWGDQARWMVESFQALESMFGGEKNCLIHLTQKGRSFVNAYQIKQAA